MALSPEDSPIVSGAGSSPKAPVTPPAASSLGKLSKLSQILYGTQGNPVAGKYPGSGLDNILQAPNLGNGNTRADKAAIAAAAKTKLAIQRALKTGKTGVGGDTKAPAHHPVAAHPIASVGKGGKGGGLASPSALSTLSAMAGGGGGSGIDTSVNKEATDLVNAQYQPQLDALKAQLAQDNAMYGQQSAQVKADQQRLDDNTKVIYNLLHNSVVGLQGQSDQQFGQTQQTVGNSYDDLNNQLQQGFNGAKQNLQGDLSQLGIADQVNGGYNSGQLANDQDLLQHLASVNKTATMGNLDTEKQGFHSLIGNEATQAFAAGDDRQSAINTDAQKQLINLQNNLQNQINAINTQTINVNTEKGAALAAMKEKLQAALNQTNNQLALNEAKLSQGAQRINISEQSLAQRINQDNFNNQLALAKLNKVSASSAAQNKTKLGNAEATLAGLMPNTSEAGQAFDYLTGGKLPNGSDILTLLNAKGAGAISTKDLQPEANALASKYHSDPAATLKALQLALLGLGGYGTT